MQSLQAIHHISSSLIQTFQQIRSICEEGIKCQSKHKQYFQPINHLIDTEFKQPDKPFKKQKKSKKFSQSQVNIPYTEDVSNSFQFDIKPGKKAAKKAKIQYKNDDEQDGQDLPKKKKRSDRDPNKPKKPLGAFFIFQEAEKQYFKKKYETAGLTFNEFRRKISEYWASMPQRQKQQYIEKFQRDLHIYHVEIEKYYQNNPSERPVTSSNNATPKSKKQGKKSEIEFDSDFLGQNQTQAVETEIVLKKKCV